MHQRPKRDIDYECALGSGTGGMSRQPVVKPFIEREGNPEIAGTDTQLNFRFQAAVKISAAGY
jgi:hypothetical protein